MTGTLLLIDTSIFLHKAAYVEGHEGENAVRTFWGYIDSLRKITSPDHIVFTLDDSTPTFRHKMYSPYKAQRPEKTEEFLDFKQYIEYQIKKKYPYELAVGFESDDWIGSLSVQYPGRVYIASADLDLSQLVNNRVTMLKPKSGKYVEGIVIPNGFEVVNPSYIINRFGIFPDQIPEYKALAGDSSDNIKLPIRGLGGVAAAKMLIMYDTIEGIYENINHEEFILPKFREGLLNCKDQVDLFLKLTTIKCDLSCSFLQKS